MMFLFNNLKDNKNYNDIDKYKEINSDLVKDIFVESVSYFVAKYANPPTAKSPPTIDKQDEDLCNRIEDDAQKVVRGQQDK